MSGDKVRDHSPRRWGKGPPGFVCGMVVGVVIICSMALLAGTAGATHVGISSGGGQAGPITTASAGTLPQGRWAGDFGLEYLSFDTFSEERLLEFAAEDEEIHNVDSLLQYNVGLSYGLSPEVTIHVRVPYVTKTDIVESEPPDEVHDHGTAHGFGDIAIHAHHRVPRFSGEGFGFSLTYGVKLPTGQTDDTDNEGIRFEPEFQPGSGSWDPFFGVELSKVFRGFSLDANLLYTVVNEGAQGADLGDVFNYNVALSRRFPFPWGRVDAILEANGLWKDYERIDGDRDPDSGGTILYVSPGLRIGFGNAVAAYASMGFPVIEDLNGTQNDVDYRTVFGLAVSR